MTMRDFPGSGKEVSSKLTHRGISETYLYSKIRGNTTSNRRCY